MWRKNLRLLVIATACVVVLTTGVACDGQKPPGQTIGLDAPVLAADPAVVTCGSTTRVVVTPAVAVPGVAYDLDAGTRVESVLGSRASATLDRDASTATRAVVSLTVPDGLTAPLDVRIVLRLRTALAPGGVDGAALVLVTPCGVAVPSDNTALDALRNLAGTLQLTMRGPTNLADKIPLLPLEGVLTRNGSPVPALDSLTAAAGPLNLPVRLSMDWSVDGGVQSITDPVTTPKLGFRLIPDQKSHHVTVHCKVTLRINLGTHAVTYTIPTPLAAPSFTSAIQVPTLLALYRAPDFGVKFPAWRQDGNPDNLEEGGNVDKERDSGVVVFGAPLNLATPGIGPLGSLIPSPVADLNALGTDLFRLAGPIDTPLGRAGLSQLPTGQALRALPATVQDAIRPLQSLAETVTLLGTTVAALATHNVGQGPYARINANRAIADLGQVAMIGNYPFPGAEVQDEAEAAIFIGSDRSGADLFVLTESRPRAQNIIGVDSGVGRLTPAPGGFVAVFPDLAAAGPGNESVNGWLPTRVARYTEAHPHPVDNRYGTLTITTPVDQDRGIGSDEPLARTTVMENNRRENTLSRTISSLKLF